MTTQHQTLFGHGIYKREEINVIVRRAHMERAQALREFVAWAFARPKQPAKPAKRSASLDAVVCG